MLLLLPPSVVSVLPPSVVSVLPLSVVSVLLSLMLSLLPFSFFFIKGPTVECQSHMPFAHVCNSRLTSPLCAPLKTLTFTDLRLEFCDSFLLFGDAAFVTLSQVVVVLQEVICLRVRKLHQIFELFH